VSWHSALVVCATVAGLMAVAEPAGATPPPPDRFTQTNLIGGDSSTSPSLVDPNLTNAWGLASSPTGPIWVSDNQSGFATVYTGGISGSAVSLALTVQVPGGNPTGQVFNSDASAFPVGGASGSHAVFIVDSDQNGTDTAGSISAWNGGASFVTEDSSAGGAGGMIPQGAIFKGLAIADNTAAGPELFAADVANARIDVFDQNFAPVSTPHEFRDPRIPRGWAPFNVQNLNGKVYVTYGKQNASKDDVVPGRGLGIVDVYTVDGKLIRRLASPGCFSPLNEPWGLTIAPAGFGPFAGDLLVGNLGDGRINAFDPNTGRFLGPLRDANGHPFAADGLWGLQTGNAAFGGASSVVFSAGPGGYLQGVVGELNPAG
jgi:uncharacterized protein (TIGR03118 family)